MKCIKIGQNWIVTFKNGCSFSTPSLLNALKVVYGKPLKVAR